MLERYFGRRPFHSCPATASRPLLVTSRSELDKIRADVWTKEGRPEGLGRRLEPVEESSREDSTGAVGGRRWGWARGGVARPTQAPKPPSTVALST